MSFFPLGPPGPTEANTPSDASPRPAKRPLSAQLKRLHAVNAERLQALEGRVQVSVRQQEEWVMEKQQLLSHIERQQADLTRLHIRVEEHSAAEAALERTIGAYHRHVVDLQSEFSVAVESMERRGCDLQVELAEWKEKAEAERLQRCTVEEELATAHRQHDDLQRTIDAQLAEIESLTQQVVDVQQLLLLSTGDSSSAQSEGVEGGQVDGNSPRPGRASPLMAPSLLSPPLLSAYHLLIPSSSRSPPAVPASLYEELVDLHETVQSLRQQLHAAEAVEAQHERRAAEAEQRVLPLQLQVQQLTAEVEELRLLCGDVEERKRKRAALEAECREDVRQWRLQREEDFNRRLEERATQRERREKDEEEWRAHSSRQLAAAVDECAALVQELASMWASKLSSSSSSTWRPSQPLHPAASMSDASTGPPTALAMDSVRVLKQLRSAIVDQQARAALRSADCTVQ